MIFPNKLLEGDKIGTTAPSFGCIDDMDSLRLENAEKKLKEVGFDVIETKNVRTHKKLESSSAKERAEEFMKLYEDKDVNAIIITSGGEILMEILPYLDFNRLKDATPKWVQGYSDPSLLNYMLTTKLNIATINGMNIKSFGMNKWHRSLFNDIEFLKNGKEIYQESFDMFEGKRNDETIENPYYSYNLNEKVEYKSLYGKDDIVRGRVIGGCIDVLDMALGSKFDNTVEFCNQFPEGMIWYIDNCELNIAAFYREIWKMKNAGWFNNVNGFLIGRTAVNKEYFDFNYEDALHKAFDDFNVPVFYDLDIGHVAPQWIMINGSFGEFKFDNGKGSLIQRSDC